MKEAASSALRGFVVGSPKAGTIWVVIRHKAPKRPRRDMPEPPFAGISARGWRYLFSYTIGNLTPQPGREVAPFAERAEAAYRFP